MPGISGSLGSPGAGILWRLFQPWKATKASLTPPMSPMFSPSVSLPFTWTPGSTSTAEYCASTQAACCSNFAATSGAHHSCSTPSPSDFLPWSSKPWVSSWPITVPIAP